MASTKPKSKPKNNTKTQLQALQKRVTKLEKAVKEKDREIREISIRRSEVIEEFAMLRDMLKKLGTTQDMIERVSKAKGMETAGEKGEGPVFPYKDRMILLNRIDIYRLFLTVIIVSSELRYPRKLSSKEEKDLQKFITDLEKFETLILNASIDEDKVWNTGRNIEKRILNIFNQFFSMK
jgi:DNA-binding protein H-NS